MATLVSWAKDADCAWLVSRAKIFLSKLPAHGETSSGNWGQRRMRCREIRCALCSTRAALAIAR